MKAIGNPYIIRGKVAEGSGNTKRLQLFDGRFDTAYKVTKLVIAGIRADDTSSDCVAVLMTEDTGRNADFWDWSDNREIGWASTDHRTADGVLESFSLVDPDNLVIEDLFITVNNRSSSNPIVNYYIEMQKYDISEYQGALSMVRNRSQG
tara:strand:+ start:485 stop:934 length:450 start_codon:yes stop_codon:yes gene_type:complete